MTAEYLRCLDRGHRRYHDARDDGSYANDAQTIAGHVTDLVYCGRGIHAGLSTMHLTIYPDAQCEKERHVLQHRY